MAYQKVLLESFLRGYFSILSQGISVFLLSANELVDSLQRNDSKSYWSLIRKLMKGTSQNYSIPPLYDNDSNELIYDDKIKANLQKYSLTFDG
jgi:hypothetical protein